MNAEFNVWLLIVGLVLGAGLVWLVIMDARRREAEVDAVERPREAAWLSAVMAEDGFDVSPEAAERLLAAPPRLSRRAAARPDREDRRRAERRLARLRAERRSARATGGVRVAVEDRVGVDGRPGIDQRDAEASRRSTGRTPPATGPTQ